MALGHGGKPSFQISAPGFVHVSKWAVRLHGGIATTADNDIDLYYRRSKAADIAFGTTDFHREIVARKIGLV